MSGAQMSVRHHDSRRRDDSEKEKEWGEGRGTDEAITSSRLERISTDFSFVLVPLVGICGSHRLPTSRRSLPPVATHQYCVFAGSPGRLPPPSMSMQSLKNRSRRDITARLKALDVAQIKAQSALTAATIANFPPFQQARSVGLYMHLPVNELHTDGILDVCFRQKKQVYLPRIEQLHTFGDVQKHPKQQSCLHFLAVRSKQETDALLPRGKYQIREPDYSPNRSNDLLFNKEPLDLLFLPGVAFTRSGKRLGHGAGYYDDFIKRYRSVHAGKTPLLVGIGLPDQLIDDETLLQLEDHDETLDYVIVGNSIFPSKT